MTAEYIKADVQTGTTDPPLRERIVDYLRNLGRRRLIVAYQLTVITGRHIPRQTEWTARARASAIEYILRHVGPQRTNNAANRPKERPMRQALL